MNRNNGPISPLSMNSNDSFASRYGPAANLGGTPNDVPYGGGPYGAARPARASPPGSQHPSGSTDMSRPSASSGSMRPPSSASSVGGRSDGRMGFGGPSNRDSGRSIFRPENEDVLSRHYHVLKGYLASSLRDEKGNLKPNRARDKLLRLSVTQFMELSTDVFDELIRREDERLQRVKDVPRSLLPKPNFHPKRNQARQKLSTLPIERFKQLATDVFYELERRIPRFNGGDIDRPPSGNSHGRAQSRGNPGPLSGYRGPHGGPGRPPLSPGMGPPSYQSFRPSSPGMNGTSRHPSEGSETGSIGRPLPKTFQSNTIVPNKSTMVEEDDDDDDGDAFGLDKGVPMLSDRRSSEAMNSGGFGTANDQDLIRTQGEEIEKLKDLVGKLERNVLQRSRDLEDSRMEAEEKDRNVNEQRNEWGELREELEQKVLDAQRLHDEMKNELEVLKSNKVEEEHDTHENHERNLRDVNLQLESAHDEKEGIKRDLNDLQDEHGSLRAQLEDLRRQHDDLQQHCQLQESQLQEARNVTSTSGTEEQQSRIQALEQDLARQEQLTSEVQERATQYLQEMRALSAAHTTASDSQESLASRISALEREIEAWRTRYARLKAQNKSLRASTVGLPAFDTSKAIQHSSIVSEDGLVESVDLSRFQLAIDELLLSGRQSETEPMLAAVKDIALSVASITSAIGTSGYPTPSPSPHSPYSASRVREPGVAKLKARVMGTANSLITATKQHASASGLSPVALLDAAASNLTHAVIELVKTVGIRPSSPADLADEFPSPPHEFHVETPAMLSTTPAVPMAPLNLTRSNTSKKANGWFGWGKSGSVDETPLPDGAGEMVEQGEYDPYR